MVSSDSRGHEYYLRWLVRLARTLLGAKFTSGNDIWELQLSLLRLQQQIQHDIRVLKTDASAAAASDLDWLRWTRHQSRRFGDAFAWILLDFDRRLLFGLSENDPVPVAQQSDTSDAVLYLAQEMSAAGWGFPVLHDVTDLLRIGDITFINPQDRKTHTVEVKTHLVAESADQDAELLHREYEVTALFAGRPEYVDRMIVNQRTSKRRRALRAPRVRRQLARLDRAKQLRDADLGLAHIDGKPHLQIEISHEAADNWNEIARLFRIARRRGYAHFHDDFIDYVFLYNAEGISKDTVADSRITEDIKTSGLLNATQFDASLSVMLIPSEPRHTYPEKYLPYFIYPLPRATIEDLVSRRMTVIALLNIGMLAQFYHDSGLNVRLEPSKNPGTPPEIVIAKGFKDKSGSMQILEYHGIWHQYVEHMHEFRPGTYYIEAAHQMIDMAIAAALSSDLRAGK